MMRDGVKVSVSEIDVCVLLCVRKTKRKRERILGENQETDRR